MNPGIGNGQSVLTREEFLSRWRSRCHELRQVGALVNAAALLEEVLADVNAVMAAETEHLLNLQQAARESGYSAEHLGRLVREGRIPNAGRPNAPRIRLRDLPRKAGYLPPGRDRCELLETSKQQIARSIVKSKEDDSR